AVGGVLAARGADAHMPRMGGRWRNLGQRAVQPIGAMGLKQNPIAVARHRRPLLRGQVSFVPLPSLAQGHAASGRRPLLLNRIDAATHRARKLLGLLARLVKANVAVTTDADPSARAVHVALHDECLAALADKGAEA